MRMTRTNVSLFAAALMITTAALAEQVKTEAVIVSKSDSGLSARTRQGPLNVVLSPSTEIKELSGLMKRKDRDSKSLIPGLIITVDGDLQGDTITAGQITFKERDWKTAIATKAGTMTEFGELRKAIIEGQEYVIQKEATVYFPSGSAVVASKYRQELRGLAEAAPSYGNYRISILGFADPRGNQAANERLSMRRAMNVSNYLRQTGLIQPGRVLSPSPMGEGTTAPGESAPGSNDEARRVVVRVVTPKTQLTQ